MKKDKRNTNKIKLDERFVSEVEGAVKRYYHAYDNKGNVTGYSNVDGYGSENHYEMNGDRSGYSTGWFW